MELNTFNANSIKVCACWPRSRGVGELAVSAPPVPLVLVVLVILLVLVVGVVLGLGLFGVSFNVVVGDVNIVGGGGRVGV